MASDLQANVSAVLNGCVTNSTDIRCLTETDINVTITPSLIKSPHWLDSAYWITWVSFDLFLNSALCFVGIVCAGLALAVLCQKQKQQREVSSVFFLQRTFVVTDLSFLVISVYTAVFDAGYRFHVYEHSSQLDRANHKFVLHIFQSLDVGNTILDVCLIAIIAIDR